MGGVEVIIESTGAFNSLEGGSKHLEAGAKKVVLTAPGKECPTYVVGVNEGDYDPKKDVVVSNASCTTNGMASVCKVLDESFGVEYGMMTTTHSYTGDQMILDGRHRDLRRARAGACNIVPTSTGAAKAVAEVLPQFKGKLNGIALRVPTPNVSVVDLVVKVSKKTSAEDVNAAIKAAADGLLQLCGCGADVGHGRGLGQGGHVVRQRVGLLPAGRRPHGDCCREVARGGLRIGSTHVRHFSRHQGTCPAWETHAEVSVAMWT